jgi:hypothetical protein
MSKTFHFRCDGERRMAEPFQLRFLCGSLRRESENGKRRDAEILNYRLISFPKEIKVGFLMPTFPQFRDGAYQFY